MNIKNVKSLLEALNGDARNSMHSILGFLDLVGEGTLDPAQHEYIESCRAAVDRHFRGIEDVRLVLDMVPQERLVISHFAPGELFGGILDAISGIAERKNIRLFRNVDSSVPPVVAADVDRIGHALLRMSEGVVGALGCTEMGGSEVVCGDWSDAGGEGCEVHLNLSAVPSPNATDLTFEIVASARMLPPLLMRALQQGDFEFDVPYRAAALSAWSPRASWQPPSAAGWRPRPIHSRARELRLRSASRRRRAPWQCPCLEPGRRLEAGGRGNFSASFAFWWPRIPRIASSCSKRS
jgi:hypothetical protein